MFYVCDGTIFSTTLREFIRWIRNDSIEWIGVGFFFLHSYRLHVINVSLPCSREMKKLHAVRFMFCVISTQRWATKMITFRKVNKSMEMNVRLGDTADKWVPHICLLVVHTSPTRFLLLSFCLSHAAKVMLDWKSYPNIFKYADIRYWYTWITFPFTLEFSVFA